MQRIEQLFRKFFLCHLVIGVGKSYEKIETLVVDLSPKACSATDHIAVLSFKVLLHKGTARRAVLEIGQHFLDDIRFLFPLFHTEGCLIYNSSNNSLRIICLTAGGALFSCTSVEFCTIVTVSSAGAAVSSDCSLTSMTSS